MNLTEIITQKLAIFKPIILDIQDDSAMHLGHTGNTGGGHFTVKIVSSQFSQKSQIMRHRMIYQALTHLIPQQIHAISILAISPDDTTLEAETN